MFLLEEMMNKEINLAETELTIINDAQTIRCNIQNTVAADSTSDYVFVSQARKLGSSEPR